MLKDTILSFPLLKLVGQKSILGFIESLCSALLNEVSASPEKRKL